MTSAAGCTGGIAGFMSLSGSATNYENATISIQQCTNTASVTGQGRGVAGIMGHYAQKIATNKFEIIRCRNSGAIRSTQDVGGIAGYMYTHVAATGRGLISECWNSGAVQATTQYAGGIVALHYYLDVIDCLNTGEVTDANGTPGGISGRINGANAEKIMKFCYNANGTTGIVGTATTNGATNFTKGNLYYKAASGVSDSYGSAYSETAFDNLNGNGKWKGTTNPRLAYFHTEHTYVNGSCECGVLEACPHNKTLTLAARENGGVAYVCGVCDRDAYLASPALTDIFVGTSGKTPLTCPSLETLGTASVPFEDFETAMQYAAFAAVEGKNVTVHIVDHGYVPESYASPQYAGQITITGKESLTDTSKGILHFDSAANRRYYANGDVTFEQLIFSSTAVGTSGAGGARFFAQNHKWVMGEGLEMANAGTGIALSGYTTLSDFKLYLYGGYELEEGDASLNMQTNLTVRSGDYWVICGWNLNVSAADTNTGLCVPAKGTGTLTIGKKNANDRLATRYIIGYSSNIQPLSANSKLTMILDGEMLVRTFYYGTQHAPDVKKATLFETDIILKNGVKLNTGVSTTLNGETVTGIMDIATAEKTTSKLNVYVDARSTEAEKASALFVGPNADTSIQDVATEVFASTYVDYCSNHTLGRAHGASAILYTDGDACNTVCDECGAIAVHNVQDAVWVQEGNVYTLTCRTCNHVLATADLPYVCVDAFEKDSTGGMDIAIGSDTADGLSAKSEVATLDEAIRRMKDTGGKVVLTDRYPINGNITLPKYNKEIIFTAEGQTGFRYVTSITGRILNLGGPTKFENILINNASKIWIIAAHWNDLTFGEGVSVWGSSYIIMGQNDLPADPAGNPVHHNAPAHATLTLHPVKQNISGKLFFHTVYLGDRGARGDKTTGYTVSNKTVVANIHDVEIEKLYAGTLSSAAENAQMANCNTIVNLHGNTVVQTMYNGHENTANNCGAYLNSLELNFKDNSTVARTSVAADNATAALLVRNVRDLKVYVSGAADGRKEPIPTEFDFSPSQGYVRVGSETADFKYSSHSFVSFDPIACGDLYDGRVIYRVQDECAFIEATDGYTPDGRLYACACGRTEAHMADGIRIWTRNASVDASGNVTVDLYAKSNIPFWAVNFTVTAEGYTLSDVESLLQTPTENAAGFTFLSGDAGMVLLKTDTDNLTGTLAETKIATLTFTKNTGTTADASFVVTVFGAYDAEENDLTEQTHVADGIYLWTKNASTDASGNVTVDLYAKSNIPFWAVNFTVAAEGYRLANVEGLLQAPAENAEGFTFAKGSVSMAVMRVDTDHLAGTLAETKVATLTFAKEASTTGTANVVITVLSAYDADENDLTAQAYAAVAEEDPYVADTTTKYGGGVILESEYVLEYTVTATQYITKDNSYMVFATTDADGYVATKTVYPYELRGKLRFAAPGIAAKNMGDKIVGTLYYTVDGVTYKAQTKSYNLAGYYAGVMNSATFADASYNDLKTLLKTMFNYATAAQNHFGYNVENPANSILNAADRYDYANDATATNIASAGTFNGATYVAAASAVVLKQRILFSLEFELVGAAHIDLTELTFHGNYTDINGNARSFTIAGDKMRINENGRLCFDIDQVAAKDLNQAITGALYHGDTQVSAILTVNLESYVAKMLAHDGIDANLKAVCKAVLDYSRAAATWLKK